MHKINLKDNVFQLCFTYKFFKQLLIDNGIVELKNHDFLNQQCKLISLKKILIDNNISLQKFNSQLNDYGFTLQLTSHKNRNRTDIIKMLIIDIYKNKDYKKAKSNLSKYLGPIHTYEFDIAINSLFNNGMSVVQFKKIFEKIIFTLDGNIIDTVDNLSNQTLLLLDFIKHQNKKHLDYLINAIVAIDLSDRLEQLQYLYFDLTKYYIFKENYLLKPLRNSGSGSMFKIMGSIDKDILSAIQNQLKNQDVTKVDLAIFIEKIIKKIKYMKFAEENIMIYLLNTYVKNKTLTKINKKIANKD